MADANSRRIGIDDLDGFRPDAQQRFVRYPHAQHLAVLLGNQKVVSNERVDELGARRFVTLKFEAVETIDGRNQHLGAGFERNIADQRENQGRQLRLCLAVECHQRVLRGLGDRLA